MAEDKRVKKYLAVGAKSTPNAGVIKQVINFVAGLLPTKLVKAIDILLHPCCDLEITAKATCTGEYTYDLTIDFSRPVYLNDSGIFYVTVGGYIVRFNEATLGSSIGTWIDGTTTLTLTNVHIDAFPPDILGIPPGTTSVAISLNLPIGHPSSLGAGFGDFTPGVYIQALTENVVFDNTPCIVPSDIRLKTNIESAGVSPSGIPIYNFDYIESVGKPGRFQGVMAQDLLGTAHEDAVIPGEHYKVNYSKIDVEFKKLD